MAMLNAAQPKHLYAMASGTAVAQCGAALC